MPKADQKGVIKNYRVKYRESAGGSRWSTDITQEKQLLLKDLKVYTSYNICVLARTEKGEGPFGCKKFKTGEARKCLEHRAPSLGPIMNGLLFPFVGPTGSPSYLRERDTSSPTSILVEWGEVPEAGRNGLIVGYRVAHEALNTSANGTTFPVNGSQNRNYTLGGLTGFTKYNICVRAFNSFGDGPIRCILVMINESGR